MSHSSKTAFFAVALLSCVAANAAEPIYPPDSKIAAAMGAQRVLISPCDVDPGIEKRVWLLTQPTATPVTDPAPKFGPAALRLSAKAGKDGGKGDFVFPLGITQPLRSIGMWVHLGQNSNANLVGVQFADAEGEQLIAKTQADWTGWKWVEFEAADPSIEPAYPQPDKNGKIDDGPLRAISVIWFARGEGETAIVVDGIVAAVEPTPGALGVSAALSAGQSLEPGQPLAAQVMLTNHAESPAEVTIESLVQENPQLIEPPVPDPTHGTDHAAGMPNRAESGGKVINGGALTDGNRFTGASTPWGGGRDGLMQTIDLGKPRTITHLAFQSGDANWIWNVDISGSLDGQTFTPVNGLQGLDWHKKWGRNAVSVPQPFNARYVRLTYSKPDGVPDVLRGPSELMVFDGPADKPTELPSVGAKIASQTTKVTVDPRSFLAVPIVTEKAISTGSYLLSARIESGATTRVSQQPVFVMPAPMKAVTPASRFGMNAAQVEFAPLLRRLGVGWIRFENLKWQMVSPEPGKYAFDGTVTPWVVNHDKIFRTYGDHGMTVLPFLFQTPKYQQPEAVAQGDKGFSHPPREMAKYGEFVYQTVARYGFAKHDGKELLTADKLSGLKQMPVYELWNEPDLNNPDWGGFVGPIEQYFDLLRTGAEAAKRADPSARIANAGFADMKLKTVDRLRSHKYADGKSPLDFVDVINVHHYTHNEPPETATGDTNVNRTGPSKSTVTFEDDLRSLATWRDTHKPGAPIWMTETGYDTGGEIGITERVQAAWLPRNMMLILATGCEKVFLYREKGSGDTLHSAAGVIRDDGSLKPSFYSYATLIRQLDGATLAQRLPADDKNVWMYLWRRGEETVLTAWAIKGEARTPLSLGRCTVTDAFGRSREQTIDGDVTLTMFPTYFTVSDKSFAAKLWEIAERHETARRGEANRLANLAVYAFDFGSPAHVGSVHLGTERMATAVPADAQWDDAKGYGFQPTAAMENVDSSWVADPLERDGVRIAAGTQFRFQGKPGRYTLKIRVEPLADQASIIVRGGVGGDQTFAVKRNAAEAVAGEIEVGTAPLTIELSDYGFLRYATFVQK